MLESRIYKVLVMDHKPRAREATTIYVLASSTEEAEKRATDVMGLIGGPNWKHRNGVSGGSHGQLGSNYRFRMRGFGG
jgi:hypothetical protein